MPTLLEIQVSHRGPMSVSRALTDAFVEAWGKAYPDGKVITRDLARSGISYVDGAWIQAAFVPADKRTPEMDAALRESDDLLAELVAADHVVIGTPMYNFGVPAVLKAYIDQVVRYFVAYGSASQVRSEYNGLLPDRKVTIIIASRDEYTPGSPLESSDFAGPYLQRIFAFMGITSVEVIHAGNSFAVRTGQITFDDHVAKFLPAVTAAAGKNSGHPGRQDHR
jgi:FMN-dependent NADH-azoreductase